MLVQILNNKLQKLFSSFKDETCKQRTSSQLNRSKVWEVFSPVASEFCYNSVQNGPLYPFIYYISGTCINLKGQYDQNPELNCMCGLNFYLLVWLKYLLACTWKIAFQVTFIIKFHCKVVFGSYKAIKY